MAVYGNGYTHWHVSRESGKAVKQNHRGGNKEHEHLPVLYMWGNSKLEIDVFSELGRQGIRFQPHQKAEAVVSAEHLMRD